MAQGILWLPFRINKHMADMKTAINLSWGEFFGEQEKVKRTWGLRAADLLRWGNGVHFEFGPGAQYGMQQHCLNKAVHQCCCRCWWWQRAVIEALLWALSQWCRQSSQQATNLHRSVFTWVWTWLSRSGHGGPTESCVLPSVWLTAPLLHAHKTIFTLYMAPLLATCDINDAWQQAFIRIPQVAIKAYSSCTRACQGGPTGPPPGLLQAGAAPCGPIPPSDLKRATSLCIVCFKQCPNTAATL